MEARIRALPRHLVYRSPDASDPPAKCAGHILGSAYVECGSSGAAWPQPPGWRLRAIWAPTRRCWRCVRPGGRMLVLETTYGDRVHENRRDRRARLQAVVEHVLEDGGTVIVPAFSIGR